MRNLGISLLATTMWLSEPRYPLSCTGDPALCPTDLIITIDKNDKVTFWSGYDGGVIPDIQFHYDTLQFKAPYCKWGLSSCMETIDYNSIRFWRH